MVASTKGVQCAQPWNFRRFCAVSGGVPRWWCVNVCALVVGTLGTLVCGLFILFPFDLFSLLISAVLTLRAELWLLPIAGWCLLLMRPPGLGGTHAVALAAQSMRRCSALPSLSSFC